MTAPSAPTALLDGAVALVGRVRLVVESGADRGHLNRLLRKHGLR
jgi:hypothetical protein